jgi:hypothetical protein
MRDITLKLPGRVVDLVTRIADARGQTRAAWIAAAVREKLSRDGLKVDQQKRERRA